MSRSPTHLIRSIQLEAPLSGSWPLHLSGMYHRPRGRRQWRETCRAVVTMASHEQLLDRWVLYSITDHFSYRHKAFHIETKRKGHWEQYNTVYQTRKKMRYTAYMTRTLSLSQFPPVAWVRSWYSSISNDFNPMFQFKVLNSRWRLDPVSPTSLDYVSVTITKNSSLLFSVLLLQHIVLWSL